MKNRTRAVLGIFAAITTITVNAATSDRVYPNEVGKYFKLYKVGEAKMIEIAVVEAVGAEPKKTIGQYQKDLAGELVVLDGCGMMTLSDLSIVFNPLSPKTETIKATNPGGVPDGCPISDGAVLALAP